MIATERKLDKVALEASLSSIDWWLTVFAILAAVFVVGGAVLGACRLVKSNRLQTILTAENLSLQQNIARLGVNAEELKHQVALAEQRAVEATLELAKFRAPRTLTVEQQATITQRVKAFAGTRFDATVIRNDPETYQLLDMITPALEAAGWTQVNWNNNDAVLKRSSKPDVGEWAAQSVIIAVPHDLISQLWPAAESLASALAAEGILAQAQDAEGMSVKNNKVLHLLIGRKA